MNLKVFCAAFDKPAEDRSQKRGHNGLGRTNETKWSRPEVL